MRVSPSVVRAAGRVLELLQRSNLEAVLQIVRADPRLADLTLTQYHEACDLLVELGFVSGAVLKPRFRTTTDSDLNQELLTRLYFAIQPLWLMDADSLIADADDLPVDAVEMGDSLGVSHPSLLLSAIRRAHRKFDDTQRAAIGLSGEVALVDLLRHATGGEVDHVSLVDDTAGFDVAFYLNGTEWHLEIKTTTRRGRLVIYVSRHEFDVMTLDEHWRLVIVGLDSGGAIRALGEVAPLSLRRAAPRDSAGGAWASAKFELAPADVVPGLSIARSETNELLRVGGSSGAGFQWLGRR